ncbi:MAG: hypothetical protein WBA57_22405 [Elainellaceae cyanobacterium]
MGIYVGNLSYSATEQDITTLLTEYGTVENVQRPVERELGKIRGFDFVNLSSNDEENSAIKPLDNTEWMSRALRVHEAYPREQKPRSYDGDRVSHSWS